LHHAAGSGQPRYREHDPRNHEHDDENLGPDEQARHPHD
jgi:hypothetical protein